MVRLLVASFLCGSLVLATPAFAHEKDLSHRIFVSYESNGADYLSSIGVGTTFKDFESNVGVQVNSSLGRAEVMATDGFIEEFTVWDVSARFGYFSNISFFIEGGIDLTEALFHDIRYDDYDDGHGDVSDVDAFVGVGAGIRLGALQFEGFLRIREIDSEFWEAESESFSGIQVSINF
ncbi:MAG: hypothetical protein L3J46_03540 [Kangiellaceae bacterium]|nr:hypothetical protein [Kangiellaceae bacterium]